MSFDLTALLFEQRSVPRGDEAQAHIADLYGCDRATWYRRNGYAPEPFSPEKLAQFALGHAYEENVAKTLREAGLRVEEGACVELHGLTGHPDLVVSGIDTVTGDTIEPTLVECKTTQKRQPSPEASKHYAVQAAAYALALGLSKAKVLVFHFVGSFAEAEYDVDPEAWRATIARRATEIHDRTAPGEQIPPAVPDPLAPWGCQYCDFRMCEKNPKFVPQAEVDF